MSDANDPRMPPTEPLGSVSTRVYDARGRLVSVSDHAPTISFQYDIVGRRVDTTDAARPEAPQASKLPAAPAGPLLTRAFEFRLTGCETQEQSFALSLGDQADCILAIQRVTAYLTRSGEQAAASSAIGGVEAHAELRQDAIVCTASLSDFGPGDLLVVRVEVGLYRAKN